MQTVKRSNPLLRVLFVISLGVHVLLFMHIAGIYRSSALSVIELTLQNVSRPKVRNIPRPPRPEQKPKEVQFSKPQISMRRLPVMKPLDIEPLESDLSENLMERIEVAATPQAPATALVDWHDFKESAPSAGDFDTASAYFDMVRFRIERHKHYPSRARAAHMEGRVTVRFVITLEGEVRSVFIAKSSNKWLLDEAALQAVRDAAPFPLPPPRFFKEDVSLEIDIVFELT